MREGVAARHRTILPRGWAHLGKQLLIWFGFLGVYQLVRAAADQTPARALSNGREVLHLEQRATHHVLELTVQRIADSSHWLLVAVAWTYWNSEFTVVGLGLLWVYLRRYEYFARFRNTVLLANVIGLVGYIAMPTAPPRMFRSIGFEDALDSMGSVNHGSGLIQLAANPYAAMPSLHAADSLIVGIFLFKATRRWWVKAIWALWPAWVCFAVMATANHFWLDVLAGLGVALIAFFAVPPLMRLYDRRARPLLHRKDAIVGP